MKISVRKACRHSEINMIERTEEIYYSKIRLLNSNLTFYFKFNHNLGKTHRSGQAILNSKLIRVENNLLERSFPIMAHQFYV